MYKNGNRHDYGDFWRDKATDTGNLIPHLYVCTDVWVHGLNLYHAYT